MTEQPLNVELFWEKYADQPYELIQGEVVPTREKDEAAAQVITQLLDLLAEVVDEMDNEDILVGSIGCALGMDTLLAADMTYIKEENLERIADPESYVPFAPDFIIEASDDDLQARADLYLQAGTQLIWVVSPARQQVTVYERGQSPVTLTRSKTLDGGAIIADLRLPVKLIFQQPQPDQE